LTTTPFGPSVTPTSAQAAPAAARAIRTAASADLWVIDRGILAVNNAQAATTQRVAVRIE
jgi:hypothetical protein